MIKEGFIIRSNAGLYDVYVDGDIYASKPRGKFRKELKHPLVGDNVVIEVLNEKEGFIIDIKDRINYLIRPKVANIEAIIIGNIPNISSLGNHFVPNKKSINENPLFIKGFNPL